MSTTPRTPEHFPRMKHRAAGRAIRKRDREIRAVVKSIVKAQTAIEEFGKAIGLAFTGWQKAFLAEALAHQDKTDA